MKTREAMGTACHQRPKARNWDNGCQDYSDCLTCPFPKCREEVDCATFACWALERKPPESPDAVAQGRQAS